MIIGVGGEIPVQFLNICCHIDDNGIKIWDIIYIQALSVEVMKFEFFWGRYLEPH